MKIISQKKAAELLGMNYPQFKYRLNKGYLNHTGFLVRNLQRQIKIDQDKLEEWLTQEKEQK